MPQQPHHISTEQIISHLLGENSLQEQAAIHQWIEADPANRKVFEEHKWIWDQSRLAASVSTVNISEAWERFLDRTSPQKPVKRNLSWIWKAAAMLIAGGCFALYFLTATNPSDKQLIVSSNTAITDTLPDGSVVSLNKNSTVNYKGGDQRNVLLEGEAFFDVAPDPGKPFIISVNDVTVQVTGTSFNVKGKGDHTEVIVESGTVTVRKGKSEIILRQNEKVRILSNDSVLVKEPSTGQLHNYYRTRQFVCDNTPLWKLVEVLNEIYNANIVIPDPQVRSFPLTATFEDENIDSILQVISQTFKLEVHRSGKTIYLK